MYPTAPAAAINLMQKLLYFNPEKRMTAEEALKHPLVAQFHDPNHEPGATEPIVLDVDDNVKFSISEYREHLYNQIVKKKKELRKK
jgi:mitogen-activated protein kinase 15